MKRLKFISGKNEWIVQTSPEAGYPKKIQQHQFWLDRFQPGDFFYFTIPSRADHFTYCSPGITQVLGFEPHEVDLDMLIDLIHPDDLPVMEEFEAAAKEFYRTLDPKERWNYKTQYNLRLKTKTGRFKQLMVQWHPNRWKDDQRLQYVYILTDITSIKTNADQSLSLIHMYGGPSKKHYRQRKKVEPLPDFSAKELEILRATILEPNLPAAAENLNLSMEALRNHLKRMRKKSGTKSTLHLLSVAMEKNWVNR